MQYLEPTRICMTPCTQLQRAHAVVELSRDLKEAVAKTKKRRLKQAAGAPSQTLSCIFILGFRTMFLVDVCGTSCGVTH
jgi:hypothetical protein